MCILIYGWLLAFDSDPPNRLPYEIIANVIFAIGCVLMAWPVVTKWTGKLLGKNQKED